MTFIKIATTLATILLLHIVLADPIDRTQCKNVVELHGNFFLPDKSRVISGFPSDMNINWKSGDIYFTLIDRIEGAMALYVINKQTGEQKKLSVPGEGQATAIDNTNDVVYLGTDRGVYKLKNDSTAELYAAAGEDIIFLTVTEDGNTLYAVTTRKNQVLKITQDGTAVENVTVPNGHGLTVDQRGNLFFVDSKTPYVLKAGEKEPVKIEGLPTDEIVEFYFNNDEVFAIDEDSHFYHLEGNGGSVTNWGSFGLTGVYTFALDKDDNVYIGVNGAIKKFKHFRTNPCTKE